MKVEGNEVHSELWTQQSQNVYVYYPFICFRRLKTSAILSRDQLCREGVIKCTCEKVVLTHF